MRDGVAVPPEHRLVGPAVLRSDALATLYRAVRAGELSDADGRAALERVVTRRNSATLLVTHDPAWIARADAVWRMDGGALTVEPPAPGARRAAPVAPLRVRCGAAR